MHESSVPNTMHLPLGDHEAQTHCLPTLSPCALSNSCVYKHLLLSASQTLIALSYPPVANNVLLGCVHNALIQPSCPSTITSGLSSFISNFMT